MTSPEAAPLSRYVLPLTAKGAILFADCLAPSVVNLNLRRDFASHSWFL